MVSSLVWVIKRRNGVCLGGGVPSAGKARGKRCTAVSDTAVCHGGVLPYHAKYPVCAALNACLSALLLRDVCFRVENAPRATTELGIYCQGMEDDGLAMEPNDDDMLMDSEDDQESDGR